ncbi:hypothetical protein J7L27_00230, partial [Candidatus Bathyarchaeota archaeon]|nr:hypothetical protein [Candidatus Bathyarchaeota archaeon]
MKTSPSSYPNNLIQETFKRQRRSKADGGSLKLDAQNPQTQTSPPTHTRTPLSAKRPGLGCSLP